MRGLGIFLTSALLVTGPACGGGKVQEGSGTEGGSGTDGGTDGTDTDGATTTTAGSNTGGGSPLCEGVDCGGFGECVEVGGVPRCACEIGYVEDPAVPTCVPAGGTTTTAGTTGATATTTDSGGTGGSTTGNPTTSGGGLPDGSPCDSPDECAGGFCYSTYMEPGGVSESTCFSACIEQEVFELWCYADADCCEGTCNNDGYCVGA